MIDGHYTDKQIKDLVATLDLVDDLDGLIIEIGCWKGKSTAAIANRVHPQILQAVDTWKGNVDEGNVTGKVHPTVKQAMKEDIYAMFQENMEEYTKGNVVPHAQDCFEYLEGLDAPVKFCHIDASHDYMSVKKTIDMIMPHMVEGGVICGDDIKSANMKRKDLEGGVERAVRETLKGFHVIHNFYWWQK